jgi:hypothetical protein
MSQRCAATGVLGEGARPYMGRLRKAIRLSHCQNILHGIYDNINVLAGYVPVRHEPVAAGAAVNNMSHILSKTIPILYKTNSFIKYMCAFAMKSTIQSNP